MSRARIGDVLSGQGDLAAALTEYRAYIGISQRLADKDPDNAERQRGLSISHNKVGDVLSDKGDLTAALVEYRASLDIRQRLAEKDPSNALWQRDLAI
jgi:tetratricopeptide (TPR) repeat protein